MPSYGFLHESSRRSLFTSTIIKHSTPYITVLLPAKAQSNVIYGTDLTPSLYSDSNILGNIAEAAPRRQTWWSTCMLLPFLRRSLNLPPNISQKPSKLWFEILSSSAAWPTKMSKAKSWYMSLLMAIDFHISSTNCSWDHWIHRQAKELQPSRRIYSRIYSRNCISF